jgi:transcriptional regulator GlxA family with amidase domain
MASLSANSERLVVAVLFDGVMLLDLAGPLQMFQMAGGYRIVTVSCAGGEVRSDCDIGLTSLAPSAVPAEIDTLIVPGGGGALEAAEDPSVVALVAALALRARRVASVCLGAFVLAGAGLLAGRRAVTHWGYCDRLAELSANIRVEVEPIFVRDGAVWTSAGVTAGIDLALALIEEDRGRAVAREVAKRAVVFLRRPGNQAQFSRALAAQSSQQDTRFSALLSWLPANLAADLSVEALAAQVGMTARSFARHFATQCGHTPARFVELLRVEAAQGLLEQDSDSIAAIARTCGFGDDERMRRAFLRALGVAPAEYRSRFGAGDR